MSWKEILVKPTRIIGLILGVSLVSMSVFGYVNTLVLKLNICNMKYLDLFLENIGWVVIIIALREKFWNIHRRDFKKFIPLAIMFFTVIFIYTIGRQLKDALVIPHVGSEGTMAAKIFVFFFALFYQLLYNKISRVVPLSKIVYYATTPIVGYFMFFSFFLLGKTSILPSASFVAYLKLSFPLLYRFKLISLLQIWPNILYYILCEIWAVTVTLVLIWQIINKYVTKEERGRFLGAIMIMAQISALNTGLISKSLCKAFSDQITVAKFINSIIFILLLVKIDEVKEEKNQKVKESVSIMEMVRKNPVFVLAASLTVFYGLSTVWVEQFWKDKVRTLAAIKSIEAGTSSSVEYGKLNSIFMIFQSRVCIIFSLIGSALSSKASWILLAMSTPSIMLFGSIFVFGPFVFPLLFGSTDPALMAQISYVGGFFVLSLFKSLKYVCFDISKEGYINSKTDNEKKEIKNLEGLLGRAGKTFGSFFSYVLIGVTGLNFSSKFLAIILFAGCLIIATSWLYSVIILNKDLKKSK